MMWGAGLAGTCFIDNGNKGSLCASGVQGFALDHKMSILPGTLQIVRNKKGPQIWVGTGRGQGRGMALDVLHGPKAERRDGGHVHEGAMLARGRRWL
jgi:hypothetical protein